MVNPGSPSVQGIFGESGFSIGLCRDFLGAELLELPSHHLRESDSFVLGRVPCLILEALGKFDAQKGVVPRRIGTVHVPIGQIRRNTKRSSDIVSGLALLQAVFEGRGTKGASLW
jgi:hypothetical protein